MPPVATVLLRVFNGERFLREALDSVFAQRFDDFEFLVVDDGSVDRTPEILASYAGDRRLRVIRQENCGLSHATRRGVEESRGRYVAIMDADDRAHPDRLAQQIAFLLEHSDHVLVGSSLRIIDETGTPVGIRRYPLDDAALRRASTLYNPFGHPSICFSRSDAIACGGYTTEFETVEDFDFNLRLRTRGWGANLADPLVDYRIHSHSVKATKLRRQLTETIALRTIMRDRYGYRWDFRTFLTDAAQHLMLSLPPSLVQRAFETAFYRRPNGVSP